LATTWPARQYGGVESTLVNSVHQELIERGERDGTTTETGGENVILRPGR
jgi:hypothetical protein